jgi:hypothetical protein
MVHPSNNAESSTFACHPLVEHNNLLTVVCKRNFAMALMPDDGYATTDEGNRNMAERLFLESDRFDRWRFLQELLEGDADVDVVNQLLYQVLEGALKYPRKDPKTNDVIVLPTQMKTSIEMLLYSENNSRAGCVLALWEDYTDETVQESAKQGLIQLEQLLPTIDEDEDAVKSLWDIVMEIHGREAVKIRETQENTLEWKLLNTVARLLIHHDFLTLGIVNQPFP